jgi:hypothetical protein
MGAHSLVSIADKCSPNPAQVSVDANRAMRSLSCPSSPCEFHDLSGVDERSIHIEQDGFASQAD